MTKIRPFDLAMYALIGIIVLGAISSMNVSGWLWWLLGAATVFIAGEIMIKHLALDGRIRYAINGLALIFAVTGLGQLLGDFNPLAGWLSPFTYRGEVQWLQVIGALVILTVGGFGAWDLMKDKSSRQTSRRVAIALAVGAILFGLLDWLLGSHVRDLLIEYVRGEAQTVVRDRIITNRWEWWHLGAALGGAFALWAFFSHGWLRALLVAIAIIVGLGAGLVHYRSELLEVRGVARELGIPWAGNSPGGTCPGITISAREHNQPEVIELVGNCPVRVQDSTTALYTMQAFVENAAGNRVERDTLELLSCQITWGNTGTVAGRTMELRIMDHIIDQGTTRVWLKPTLKTGSGVQQMECARS